jgi:hypothetical protein
MFTNRLSLKAYIRRCGLSLTTEEKIEIQSRRSRLRDHITEHQSKAITLFKIGDIPEGLESSNYETEEDLWDDDEDDPDSVPDADDIETFKLLLPSSLGWEVCSARGLSHAAEIEIKLRVGQCNDALHAIRLAVGKKVFVFRNDVRKARSKKHKTKAYWKVQATTDLLSHRAQCYRRARKALQDLNAPHSILQKYQVLTADHLAAKETFLDSSVKGVKHKHLAWFWTVNIGGEMVDDEMLKECKPIVSSDDPKKSDL